MRHDDLLKSNEQNLLDAWMSKVTTQAARLTEVVTEAERRRYAQEILSRLPQAMINGDVGDIEATAYRELRSILSRMSADFAERGLTPTETATFIFSLKEVVFTLYREKLTGQELVDSTWEISTLVDKLGLYTFETFAAARERLIKSQAEAISDLSTPVIQMWEGIVALPLVGTIDSIRAKEIMEKLLEAVVEHGADFVIIDITGVPVVDTQVANRLMRTVESVRLLGTRSIITGINPVIAQTLVQLGVDLSQLTTKASLRAGLQQAFREMKLRVVAQEARH